MNKYIKAFLFLIFICWSSGALSGCIEPNASEYSSVSVEDIEVKPLSKEYPTIVSADTVLNVTAVVINEDKEKSAALSLDFRIIDAYSSREFAAKKVNLEPMKGRSMAYHSVQMTVPGPGMYSAEVGVSEKGKESSPTLGMMFTVEEDGNVTFSDWE